MKETTCSWAACTLVIPTGEGRDHLCPWHRAYQNEDTERRRCKSVSACNRKAVRSGYCNEHAPSREYTAVRTRPIAPTPPCANDQCDDRSEVTVKVGARLERKGLTLYLCKVCHNILEQGSAVGWK